MDQPSKLTHCPICGAELLKWETKKVRYFGCLTCEITAGIMKNVMDPEKDAERILRGENVPAD